MMYDVCMQMGMTVEYLQHKSAARRRCGDGKMFVCVFSPLRRVFALWVLRYNSHSGFMHVYSERKMTCLAHASPTHTHTHTPSLSHLISSFPFSFLLHVLHFTSFHSFAHVKRVCVSHLISIILQLPVSGCVCLCVSKRWKCYHCVLCVLDECSLHIRGHTSIQNS